MLIKSVEIIVAAVAFKLELVIVAVSKKVVKTQRRVILFMMFVYEGFRGSEHTNSQFFIA